jgi:hypothetical protein
LGDWTEAHEIVTGSDHRIGCQIDLFSRLLGIPLRAQRGNQRRVLGYRICGKHSSRRGLSEVHKGSVFALFENTEIGGSDM